MKISENEFRDWLFEEHRATFATRIVGRREPVAWVGNDFPPIHFLLQQRTERKINEIIDSLEELRLTAKELRLEKAGDSTTRIDLLGSCEGAGLTIIELKKFRQTERQAFTELLAYANHFCSVFPGLKENSITTILVAPLESRTVRDSYVQELVANSKLTLALTPEGPDDDLKFRVYYPDASYYQWFENNMFDDRSMLTVAVSFPTIDGWIDDDTTNEGTIPDHSRRALNAISSSVGHRLEALGAHALVYASQKWGNIAQAYFPSPNTILVAALNPFASFRTSIDDDQVWGECKDARLECIQTIYDQLDKNGREFWIDALEGDFHNRVIGTVREQVEWCFQSHDHPAVQLDISCPDWYGVKTSMIEAVFVHNLDISLTGILREIYSEYISHSYRQGEALYYGDDLPMYAYKTLKPFLPVWEILRGLGLGDTDEDEDVGDEA